MNFTSRSRYALKIMMDLALHADKPHVQRHDIARRQGIPSEYMDQILMRLRAGGIVCSVRGRGGGYFLAKADNEITLWELFSVAEGNELEPVHCVHAESKCEYDVACISKSPWQTIYDAIKQPLSQLTLRDLIKNAPQMHQLCPGSGVRECRPPNSAERASHEEVLRGGLHG